ncbi:type III PLP-dependent enzyme [Jannaschia sp. M317]|uniref:type III PLP-dependent enzyme n=1 Tax=Jannaschia sp. M317 TaxID=2867011 RepID=UPI0021A2F0DD|nr:type III PLP-dependent enzyme [Jannaschia sp. M317]UWQ18008.1 type III PLP-dependent enzyme [Jannaschia sp. M317]
MNAVTGFDRIVSLSVPSRVESYISAHDFAHPTLVIDVDAVERQFHALSAGLGRAHIHYAVKANPHPAIIERLVNLGSGFDAASRGEIELVLGQGADVDHVSFGNTIKKASDIRFAHNAGVTLFAVDAEEEMLKIAENAPGARVYIRVIVDNSEADWPLSRKFGCASDKVMTLLAMARDLGLVPHGLSFHVGSQTREARMWTGTLDQVAAIWHRACDEGFYLQLLNIGGGFPAFYGEEIQRPTAYAAAVIDLIEARFGFVPQIMAEPGRGMVAEAGAIAAEVVLTSKKSEDDLHRWVYLDIGRFSGLAETEGEAIRYQFVTARDGDVTGPCVLAGPSCDSADVLYEKRPIQLPLSLKAGDKIIIRNCGAYTSTYSSVCFNGFPPLDAIVI